MKKCKICKTKLTGLQRVYCSPKCNDRAYYLRNKDKYIANALRWQRENPEKCNYPYDPEKKKEASKKGMQKYLSTKKNRLRHNKKMREYQKKKRLEDNNELKELVL